MISELETVYHSWVEGKALQEEHGERNTVYDKYTGEPLAVVGMISDDNLEKAILSTVGSASLIASESAGARAGMLRSIRNRLETERKFFEQLIVSEAGKPISLAINELDRCLLTLEAGERECLQFRGEMIPADMGIGTGKLAFTQWFPAGPVLGFTPFNFPLNLALHKIVPALAAGCPIMLKPSPHTPLSLLNLARLISEAGVPSGVVNVVCCNLDQALLLVKNDRFRVFSFTGSAEIGWRLRADAGKKKVLLELGGNAPVIIDDTAELELAAKLCVRSAFAYAGQVCISTQRVICVEAVYGRFSELLHAASREIKSGDPRDAGVLNGPLIDAASAKRLELRISEALASGAVVNLGGKPESGQNNVFEPTILSRVNPASAIARDEVFAPLLILESADNFEDAVNKANSGSYGLQCGVFTNNIARMKSAYRKLQFGGIMINNTPNFRMDHMPYGGVKDSGSGREGIRYAMEEMSERRLVVF